MSGTSQGFSEHERSRIRHFLGYASWESTSQSIHLGFPSASQPAFLLESAFNRLFADGETAVRRDLCELEAIEKQMSDARRRFKVEQVGDVKFRLRESAMLRQEYQYWQTKLADDLGVVPNPYSQSAYVGMGGGLNAKVV